MYKYICNINQTLMSGKEYSVTGFIGHQVGVTAGVLRKAFASRITRSAESISPEQFVVLARLSFGQGFNQNEMGYLLKDDASITRILDSLEKKGLAVRKKSSMTGAPISRSLQIAVPLWLKRCFLWLSSSMRVCLKESRLIR